MTQPASKRLLTEAAAAAGYSPTMTTAAIKTVAYTAAAFEIVPVDATSASVAITLPTSPADKTRVTVKKIDASANTITIAAGGTAVFNKAGGATSLTLSLQNQSTTIQYQAAAGLWYVVAGDLPLSQLDLRYATLTATRTAATARGTLAALPSAPFVSAAVSITSPYSNDAQFVHPDVVDTVTGWNGYRYWMAITPYPYSDPAKENPSVYASADGLTWITPTGATNPVVPPATAPGANSDNDMVLVSGTMYLFYREYSLTGSNYEKIILRKSTDGVTWTAPQAVIDTTSLAPADHLQLISPGFVYDGTQFIMWSSKSSTMIERRTSPDGVTWSAATVCTINGYAGSGIGHVDVTRDGSSLFLFLQDYGPASNVPEVSASRHIWLGRSTDGGLTWTMSPNPLLDSTGLATRTIYRTCGLHETRNGSDYFRIWYSGIDLDENNNEVWHVGYTEGFAPDQAQPVSGLAVPGNLEISGDITVRQGGFRRLTARIGTFTRLVTASITATRARFTMAFLDQNYISAVNPSWLTELGYPAGGAIPPLAIASGTQRTWAAGDRAEIRMHQRSTDTTIRPADYWSIRVVNDGRMQVGFYDSVAVTFNGPTFSTAGDVTVARDVVASRNLKGTVSVYSPKGDFGASADGTNASDNPLRIFGDNLRITGNRTPTSSADASLYKGCLTWDDNYIYIKTSTGWKRTALTTF